MKQETHLFLLLLTISVGRSHGHGTVKGAFSKSYSSSSASASSSAFSSSFSGPSGPEDSSNFLKPDTGAISSAFSSAGASAKAGSGAYAGSSAFSSAGSLSGAGSQSQSGSFSSSGSISDGGINKSGAFSGSHNSGSGVGQAVIPVQVDGSGSITGSGSGGLTIKNGGGCGGSLGCGLSGNQGSYTGSDANSGIQSNTNKPLNGVEDNGVNSFSGSVGNNIRYNGNINNNPSKILVNDFQIPDEYTPQISLSGSPKLQFPGPQGSIHEYKPVLPGSKPQVPQVVSQVPQVVSQVPQVVPQVPNFGHTGSYSGSNHGSYSGSNQGSYSGSEEGSFQPGNCKNCKGPFPGPKGNINDYKPIPVGGGGPPAWVPEQQTQPPLVRPSPNLVSTLPGSTGSIYDSKPVTQGGVIPVVVGNPHNNNINNNNVNNQFPQNKPTTHHQETQPKPGNIAVSVIGQFPGPTGNIHSSVPVTKNTYQPKDKPYQIPVLPVQDNKKPIPSQDLIHRLPGNTGSIHDFKPVNCPNGGCKYQPNVTNNPKPYNKPEITDCTQGQCDEYGGRLGCHGEDCFGPGKKPSYVNSGSEANSKANSNSKDETGNIDITPIPDRSFPDCSKGQCNIDNIYHSEIPPTGQPGRICSGSQCLNNPQVIVPEVILPPEPPSIDLSGVGELGNLEHPNLDVNIDVRNKPEYLDGIYCPGPHCRQVPQNGKPVIKQNPNVYQHSISNANANSQNSHNQEKINVQIDQKPDLIPNDIPTEVDFPVELGVPKESNPHQPQTKEMSTPKPGGGSMDFLLPGNKPYQHHHVKPHHPKPSQPQPTPTPGVKYYECTEESCALPKPKPVESPKPIESPEHKEQIPVGTYYACSGTSCPLPHPTPNSPVPIGLPEPNAFLQNKDCVGNDCQNTSYHPCTGTSCPLPHHIPIIPDELPEPNLLLPGTGTPNYSCTGSSCLLPHPKPIPGCQGSQCGAGGKDRLFPPPFIAPGNHNGLSVNPLVIPVVVKVPSKVQPGSRGQFSESGSTANAGANSYKETLNGDIARPGTGHIPVEHSLVNSYGGKIDTKDNQSFKGSSPGCSKGTCTLIPGLNSQGFVSGDVVVQKADGDKVTVVDVVIPEIHPGHPCQGGKCSFPNHPGNIGPSKIQPCSGNDCVTFPRPGVVNVQFSGAHAGSGSLSGSSKFKPCTGDECVIFNRPGSGLIYSGGNSGSSSANFGNQPCGNGNCGHGNNGGLSGAHSGSFSVGGTKGGCKSCGLPPLGGEAFGSSGAFSSSSSFTGASSGNSGPGPFASAAEEHGFKALKELLTQGIEQNGFGGGIPNGFNKAGSFSHSGSASGGFGGSSAFSGAFSSSASSSY